MMRTSGDQFSTTAACGCTFGSEGRLERLMQRETLRIVERGTERHGSPEAAQEAALPLLADALVQIIRSSLDSGRYIVENGVVKLREEVSRE